MTQILVKPRLNGLKAATLLKMGWSGGLTSEIPSLRRQEDYFHRETAINHEDRYVLGSIVFWFERQVEPYVSSLAMYLWLKMTKND